MKESFHAFSHSVMVQMKLSMARPMFQFVIWISPLFYATITYFMYRGRSPEEVFHYVVLGSGFMALWTSIVYSSASDIGRERFYGTLENLFVAPASFALVLWGKIIGNTLWGFLSMILSFGYLTFIFKVEIRVPDMGLLFLAIIFVVASISIFAFFMAMIFTLSRQAEVLMNFMEYPIFLVCGFLFPVSILPAWVQPLSAILPPTWAIELLRKVTGNMSTASEISMTFGAIAVITVCYSILAMICYRALEQKVRVDGKLGVY